MERGRLDPVGRKGRCPRYALLVRPRASMLCPTLVGPLELMARLTFLSSQNPLTNP